MTMNTYTALSYEPLQWAPSRWAGESEHDYERRVGAPFRSDESYRNYDVYEIYEYLDYVICIYRQSFEPDLDKYNHHENEIRGFAVRKKYQKYFDFSRLWDSILEQINYEEDDEFLSIFDESDGESLDGEPLKAPVIHPPFYEISSDDFWKYGAEWGTDNPNEITSGILLQYFVQVIDEIKEAHKPDKPLHFFSDQRRKLTKVVILKNKVSKPAPKSAKKQRGFMQVAWSSLVKERDKQCMECGNVNDLHAHHIKSFKNHPELRYDVNNGITLCGHCHRLHHIEHGK